MVGSGHVVKLGDFGMARAMYDSDYYRFGRKGKIVVDLYQLQLISLCLVSRRRRDDKGKLEDLVGVFIWVTPL